MAYTFDTKQLIAESSSNPVTNTYTCGATATLLVLCITLDGGSRTGTAPTYNSLPLTKAGNTVTSDEGSAEIWYLLAPPVSAPYTVNVPNFGTLPVQVQISSYIASGGVSRLQRTAEISNQVSTNPTLAVTPTSQPNVIVQSLFTGLTSPPSANSDILLYKNDTGVESNAAQYKITTSTDTQTLSWTAASDDWCLISAVFDEQGSPTVDLNTPTNNTTGVSTTPDLVFTGTDADNDTIEYNVQIDTVNTFNSGGGGGFVEQAAGTNNWTGVAVNPTNGDVFCNVQNGSIWKQTGGIGDFVDQNVIKDWRGLAINPLNGDVFASVYQGSIWKQTGGVGDFVDQNVPVGCLGIAVNSSNGDVFGCSWGGSIWKQTGGVGDFIDQNVIKTWIGVAVNSSNGDVFGSSQLGSIFKQTGGTGDFVDQNVPKDWRGMAVNSVNGDVLGCVSNGGIWKQAGGTGAFVEQTVGTKNWYSVAVDSSNRNVFGSVFGGGIWKLESSNLLDKLSVTDVGFTAGHPFTSGVQITYTVQSALAVATTYYWRVRGIDPTGTNTWGVWSSIFSFTTGGGPEWLTKVLKWHNGSTWVEKPLKWYNESTWVEKPLKINV